MGNLPKTEDPTEIVTPVAETDSVIRCLGQAWRCQPLEMKIYKCIACCPGETMASRPQHPCLPLLDGAALLRWEGLCGLCSLGGVSVACWVVKENVVDGCI